MSSHDVTILGYLVFLAAGVALAVRAHAPASRIATISQVFGRIMHSRTGRIAMVAWWAFIGFHLFSK